MKDLNVIHDNNSVFEDYSHDSRDYLRDSFQIDFVNIEDSIHIGLYKPFNRVYIEFDVAAIGDANLVFTYWDGTAYQELKTVDDSKGFTRSGFIGFEKPIDWTSETIEGKDRYYIKLNADDFSATVQGLNIVFSDDNDLASEVRGVNEFTQGSDTSFIAYHAAARNEIVQTLNNGGNSTQIKGTDTEQRLSKWDLLDIGEVSQAAKFLCLSKIFFDISENPDDKHYQRYVDFGQKFGEAFKLFRMSLDRNDDGIADDSEKTQLRRMSVIKR